MSRGKVWNTKKINEEKDRIERGLQADYSPFFDGKIDMKAADIVFDYTQEEFIELAKCAADVTYFGNKYCYSMTDEGICQITLRPYQEDMLKAFQDNRFVVMLASRQIGKCFIFNTKIKIKIKQKNYVTTVGELYYQIIKAKRKLTFIEKTKLYLWRIYNTL
jgi:hypothetical protein